MRNRNSIKVLALTNKTFMGGGNLNLQARITMSFWNLKFVRFRNYYSVLNTML